MRSAYFVTTMPPALLTQDAAHPSRQTRGRIFTPLLVYAMFVAGMSAASFGYEEEHYTFAYTRLYVGLLAEFIRFLDVDPFESK